MDPVPDPIGLLPEKFLGYSRESNPRPLEWQSDLLIIINIIIIIIYTGRVKAIRPSLPLNQVCKLYRKNDYNVIVQSYTKLINTVNMTD